MDIAIPYEKQIRISAECCTWPTDAQTPLLELLYPFYSFAIERIAFEFREAVSLRDSYAPSDTRSVQSISSAQLEGRTGTSAELLTEGRRV